MPGSSQPGAAGAKGGMKRYTSDSYLMSKYVQSVCDRMSDAAECVAHCPVKLDMNIICHVFYVKSCQLAGSKFMAYTNVDKQVENLIENYSTPPPHGI